MIGRCRTFAAWDAYRWDNSQSRFGTHNSATINKLSRCRGRRTYIRFVNCRTRAALSDSVKWNVHRWVLQYSPNASGSYGSRVYTMISTVEAGSRPLNRPLRTEWDVELHAESTIQNTKLQKYTRGAVTTERAVLASTAYSIYNMNSRM